MRRIAAACVPSALRRSRAACALAASAVLVAGCAPGALSTQSQRIAYDPPSDSCRPQVLALDSTGDVLGAQILTSAAIGAGVGALGGGLIGQNWQSALIGTGTGAVLGVATAYWAALQQQQIDRAALDTRVADDLARENAAIDRTQVAFDQLTDCRFRQAEGVRVACRGGRIDRPEAEADMAAIWAWAG